MINVDLTKIVHPRAWDFLPAFLPGMWFEISVFLANPEIFRSYACRANLAHYSMVFIALLGAFILGTAFMLWVWLLHVLLSQLHRVSKYFWTKLITGLFGARSPLLSWIAKSNFLRRAHDKAVAQLESELRGLTRAWKRAARQLLQQRYGIELPYGDSVDQGEWRAWSGALGTQDRNPQKGILFLTAVHATGWSGIAAAYCAPVLRNRFYLSFAFFLIASSVWQVWMMVGWWNRPATRWMLALRGVLTDFPAPSREVNEKVKLANTL
jgi:hypothetical protein